MEICYEDYYTKFENYEISDDDIDFLISTFCDRLEQHSDMNDYENLDDKEMRLATEKLLDIILRQGEEIEDETVESRFYKVVSELTGEYTVCTDSDIVMVISTVNIESESNTFKGLVESYYR